MTLLLHLGLTRQQYWQRTPRGWQALSEKPDTHTPVWIVTDLPEESYAAVETPRLFGRDRDDLLNRQMATLFPDTTYRIRLDMPQGQGVMDRLAPTRHTLFGITNPRKIDEVLDAQGLPVAALCPISLLLARVGRHQSLPDSLFVVLPTSEGLRIVFIKNRIPQLTRLASIPDQIETQVDEIIRTHRYLEKTHVLKAQQRLPVLLLCNPAGFVAPLALAGLDVIAPPPPWNSTLPGHVLFSLFDLALREQPYGQIAPIERRTTYLGNRLRRYAWITTTSILLIAAGLAALRGNDMLSILHEKTQSQAIIETLNQKTTALDQQAVTFGARSDLVRRALALNTREMLAAPGFVPQLKQIAHRITAATLVTPTRLAQLDWHMLAPGEKPCDHEPTGVPDLGATPTRTDNSPKAPAAAIAATAVAASSTKTPPQAHISFDLLLPSNLSPRLRLESIRSLSAHLKEIPGITLWSDPNAALGKATLKGGSLSSTNETPLHWCMTLPGNITDEESPTP